MPRYLDVDPRTLHLPTTRWADGADPSKLARQLSQFGTSTTGMPAIEVHEDPDGRLVIQNGVTRATRVAKFLPGQLVRVGVTAVRRKSVAKYPTVADRLP
jgi:hypothetical protein